MTKSQLPKITLTCTDGHQFATRAAGGRSVRCTVCGKSKRVPVDRPRTAREAASYAAPGGGDHQDPAGAADTAPDPARELAERWEAETRWPGAVVPSPGRAGDECPECEGPLSWEPRRTLVYCPACQRVDLPPAVSEHYQRQQSQRAEVATRQHADPIAEKAARARLRALVIQAEQWADEWLETIGDPESYDRIQWQRAAREFSATFCGWMPELRNAETEDELTEIKSVIVSELLNSDPGKELRAEYDAARNRAEQAEERRQRAEEIERAEAEAERARQQKMIEASRNDARKVANRRAITSGKEPTHNPDPYGAALGSLATLMVKTQQNHDRAIEQRGKCTFAHTMGPKPADRLYWVPQRDWRGTETGYALPNTPQLRACSKHFAALEAEMTRQGYPDTVWRDLHAS